MLPFLFYTHFGNRIIKQLENLQISVKVIPEIWHDLRLLTDFVVVYNSPTCASVE